MTVIETNIENFTTDVLNSDKAVVVDFWAVWCAPCKAIAPVLEEISNQHSSIKIAKVDVDKNGELAVRYGIKGVPTFLMFYRGEIIANKVGAVDKTDLLNWINDNLNDNNLND